MFRTNTRASNLGFRYFQSKAGSHLSKFKTEFVCSEDNILKCIKSMQSAPQVKLSQKQYEKEAAVLIPLCLHNSELSLLYTVRSAKLRNHVRQVSFPGGLRDSSSESWENCALRETEEEIGIPKDQIEIWGTGRMIIPARPPAIMPIVGFVNQFDFPSLKLNSDEVETCFTVTLKDLCSHEYKRYTQFRGGYCVPSFVGAEKRIWGITGLITHLFLNALLSKDIYSHPIKFVSKYRAVNS